MSHAVRTAVASSFIATLIACGGQHAASPKSASGEPAGSEEASSAAPAADSSSSPGEASAKSSGAGDDKAESKASGSSKSKFDPIALCMGMCTAVGKKCGEAKQQVCKATCDDKYDVVPEDCAKQTQEAFECGRNAQDLLCSSFVPPSCATQFDTLASCATLGNGDRHTEYRPPVPQSWKRVEDKKNGFAVWMPPEAKAEEQPDGHAWVATDTDGVEYRALVFPAPAGKNPDAVLKTAAGTFLKDCTKALKLRGRWDKDNEVGVVFGGKCKDGTGWRGVMRMAHSTIYALGLHSKTEKEGQHDGFAFSFEYLKSK